MDTKYSSLLDLTVKQNLKNFFVDLDKGDILRAKNLFDTLISTNNEIPIDFWNYSSEDIPIFIKTTSFVVLVLHISDYYKNIILSDLFKQLLVTQIQDDVNEFNKLIYTEHKCVEDPDEYTACYYGMCGLNDQYDEIENHELYKYIKYDPNFLVELRNIENVKNTKWFKIFFEAMDEYLYVCDCV